MTQEKQKYLTVAQAEKARDMSSLWLLNNSGEEGIKGRISITIPEGNGQVNTINLPNTFIPVDITTQATKNAVLSNPNFRRLVQGAFIKIASEDYAQELLGTPKAQAEQRRLFALASSEPDAIEANAPQNVRDLISESSGEISGFALNLAHNSDGNEDDLIASLHANADSLKPVELQYIVNNSTFGKLKAEAAKLIMK